MASSTYLYSSEFLELTIDGMEIMIDGNIKETNEVSHYKFPYTNHILSYNISNPFFSGHWHFLPISLTISLDIRQSTT